MGSSFSKKTSTPFAPGIYYPGANGVDIFFLSGSGLGQEKTTTPFAFGNTSTSSGIPVANGMELDIEVALLVKTIVTL